MKTLNTQLENGNEILLNIQEFTSIEYLSSNTVKVSMRNGKEYVITESYDDILLEVFGYRYN